MIQRDKTPKMSQPLSLDSQLWQMLKKFSVDEPGAELSFVGRLAEENRWPVAYAERVFGEYKRFLYLAVAAEHPASPSDAVDQAWHLHLAYTRSYWEQLCGKVLNKPLHHLPTKGGQAEDEKHSDLYRRTLESYERHFGQAAPFDIWPRANQSPEKFARIRTSDFWMLRKPGAAFQKTVLAIAAIIVFSLTMAACSSSGDGIFPFLFIGSIVAGLIYYFRDKLGNGGDCSSSSCSSSCSSGGGFFSFFSSCSSDSGSSDSSCSSDSGGSDSSCSSSSCSSCSSCSSSD